VKLVVCAMADLEREARRCAPTGAISLLTPDQAEPAIPGDPPRLTLRFNDISEPVEGLVAPSMDMVDQLLAFASPLAPDDRLMVHCWMGISRSPAAAFILACARNPERPEEEIAQALRQAAPSASPNPLLVQLADERLERRGRMSAAIARVGRGCDAASGAPFELEI
jgi:predicted protein tyrosine phosphatase